jgi:hypothetical protein
MRLLRKLCVEYPASDALAAGLHPLQIGLGGSPWRVTVASILICRARRTSAEPVLWDLLDAWPDPEALGAAPSEAVEDIVRPLGLHRNRARHLIRLSQRWHTDSWSELRDLPGVGEYVEDSVRLCSFAWTTAIYHVKDKAMDKFLDELVLSQVKVICAWCKKHMRGKHDAEKTSHGICDKCFKEQVGSDIAAHINAATG